MSKKKTRVTVELTRRDVLSLVGVATGSAVAAVVLTSGPLSPFAGLQREQLTAGQESAGHGATGVNHWGMVINLDSLHRLRILPACLLSGERCPDG